MCIYKYKLYKSNNINILLQIFTATYNIRILSISNGLYINYIILYKLYYIPLIINYIEYYIRVWYSIIYKIL